MVADVLAAKLILDLHHRPRSDEIHPRRCSRMAQILPWYLLLGLGGVLLVCLVGTIFVKNIPQCCREIHP